MYDAAKHLFIYYHAANTFRQVRLITLVTKSSGVEGSSMAVARALEAAGINVEDADFQIMEHGGDQLVCCDLPYQIYSSLGEVTLDSIKRALMEFRVSKFRARMYTSYMVMLWSVCHCKKKMIR
jgi:hypothetical protein